MRRRRPLELDDVLLRNSVGIEEAIQLLVAWHAITWEEQAREYEKRLLARFAELHDGGRPFANLTG